MTTSSIRTDERAARARELFLAGYNCSQSVFLAFSDLFGLDPTLAATLSAPFGGGMGRLREVCGAVSGMTLAAGFLSPNPTPADRAAKTANYALVQQFAEAFRRENGAIVCRELLGLDRPKDSPVPSERTAEYYRKRPCAEYVAAAARIVGRYLEERAGDCPAAAAADGDSQAHH